MLADRLDVRLARARSMAEALMVDSCTITRPGEGDPVFNPETFQYDDPPRVTVYRGRCRVQIPGDIAGARDVEAGEHQWTLQSAVIALPVTGSEGVRVNHLVHIDTAEHDQALAGREYRVDGLHHKSMASSRRLRCEEQT